MKIVFIIDSLRRDGAQRFLMHLTAGLRELGYKQTVVSLNDVVAPDVEEALVGAGCEIIRIGKSALLLAAGFWRLVGVLRKASPDIVFTMLDFADTLGRPAARLARCRALVSSIRVRNLLKPKWRRTVDRATIGWSAKIIVNSQELVPYVVEVEHVPSNRVVVIRNGVDDLRARSGRLRDKFRHLINAWSDTCVLGWMGRLRPQKNPMLLLEVCASLTSRSWKLVVLGDGPEKAALIARVIELGLSERIIWLGEQSHPEGWLAAMDVFVHTADFEGMPNAVMEAMATGLPIVASNVDGIRELVEDGVSGCLVPAGDAAGFAKRIEEFIAQPELRQRVGEGAHARMLQHFNLARMVGGYDELFRSLVQ